MPRDHISRGTKKGTSPCVLIPWSPPPFPLPSGHWHSHTRSTFLPCLAPQETSAYGAPVSRTVTQGALILLQRESSEVVQISLDQEKEEPKERGDWLQADLETKGWDTAAGSSIFWPPPMSFVFSNDSCLRRLSLGLGSQLSRWSACHTNLRIRVRDLKPVWRPGVAVRFCNPSMGKQRAADPGDWLAIQSCLLADLRISQ